MSTPPNAILTYILPFSILFSNPVWKNALTLIFGAILAKGKRTVTSCLRVMGLKNASNFSKYHWVLNHAKWSSLIASKILLGLIVKFAGNQDLVMIIDETLERRKGKKIKAKGFYRDAVRSSHKKVVQCFGLKWMILTALVKFPWSDRRWALPFMTVLEPSEKSNKACKKTHKTSVEWSIQMLKQVRRWLPTAALTVIGDGGFAAAELCWTCLKLKITMISRLRMDARLHDFPAERPAETRGRPPKKGIRLMSFNEMLQEEGLPWQEVEVNGYGRKQHRVRFITNTALWHVEGHAPIPIRWVLVVDPTNKMKPAPLFSTDVNLDAQKVIDRFIERWSIEVTFEETRTHLGIETQRQWSDHAITRTTPALMGIFSLVSLIANEILGERKLELGKAAWYQKENGTFSDALTLIRKELWQWRYFSGFSKNSINQENMGDERIDWLIDLLGCAA